MAEALKFDRYYAYDDLTRYIHSLAEKRPDLMTVTSIGLSYEGREIWCATVTNIATGAHTEKPGFWVDGNIHATEVSAASACLYFLKKLIWEYGTNPDIKRCLDTRVFYVVPRVNPDGAELYFSEKPKFLRSSTKPYPYDEEPLEGLKREDIDGDGRFLQMRIPDPNGTWKAHPEEPRLLIRRDPTEAVGTYYRLLPEGTLENWDGVTINIQPYKEGLDLNRNFPGHWRQEVDQSGAGPYPTSEPEVRAMVDFITKHTNITGGVTFHTYSGVLLRPYGTQNDESFPAEDFWTYQKIGEKGTEITGYPAISVFHDFKYHPKEVITGVFDDWIYDHLGIFGWTVEIWSPQRQAGIADYKYIDWFREHPVENDLKLLKWNDEALEGKGYVDRYPFEHPQLGRLELGGWDTLYAFRNPPPKFLEKEISTFPDWLVWHALISPKLEVVSVEVTALTNEESGRKGEGERGRAGEDALNSQHSALSTYKIRMVVQNTGWLPTYVTKKAVERKVVRPLIAEIELPDGATLETGKKREEVGQLEGRAYKAVGGFGWSSDPTEDRVKVEWAVRARPGTAVKLIARHERAGVVRREIEL